MCEENILKVRAYLESALKWDAITCHENGDVVFMAGNVTAKIADKNLIVERSNVRNNIRTFFNVSLRSNNAMYELKRIFE